MCITTTGMNVYINYSYECVYALHLQGSLPGEGRCLLHPWNLGGVVVTGEVFGVARHAVRTAVYQVLTAYGLGEGGWRRRRESG